MTKKKSKTGEISEESEWYRIKMARYYEEEWNKLFETKPKVWQKVILHEPNNRYSAGFAKDVIEAAEKRDWEDNNSVAGKPFEF